jgi:Heavy-metal resistance protein CzcE
MENAMKHFVRTAVALTLLSATLSAGAATISSSLLGEAAQPAAAVRSLVIDGDTRSVRVKHGEVVKFMSNGQEFTWAFDGLPQVLDLNQIAPAGVLSRTVRVYVDPSETDSFAG